MNSPDLKNVSDRRGFLKKSAALLVGAFAVLTPVVTAFVVLTDPIRRKTASSGVVRITTLEEVPENGIPQKFPVLASKIDAWNKFVDVPIGAIYLRRLNGKVEALNVVCPHAGCFVDFSAKEGQFLCPCHKSSFKVDGSIANSSSPSPRGLDSLPVEVKSDGSIWVKFQNFQAGRPDKVPVA